MAAITICSDFGTPPKKSDTVSTVSPSISHKVMGPDAVILVFWMLGSIKDRNGMDLTEAEDTKKRQQEYTEELYK